MTFQIDLNQIFQRESEQTEWKESVADINDVAATLCAFANDLQNRGGGYVVCGASEAQDEHGFPKLVRRGLTARRLKEVEHETLACCRDRVSPPLAPLLLEVEADDKARRILVFVQPSTGTAHTFRRNKEGAKHFVRVGRSTIEARSGLLRDLLVRKGALEAWDRRPCHTATVSDLDLLALRDALERMGLLTQERGVERYLSDGAQISPFVPSLCVAEPLSGELRPRNFALLLFGRAPQLFIPGAFSIYSVYPGVDRASQVARRIEIAGTLLDQARRLQDLLDAEAVTLFDKTDRDAPNAERYPRRALQEAMINALAHRDYELLDPSRIVSYRDRIELISPGSLPVGVSLSDLRAGEVTPRWRNQALAWVLSRLQFAQAEGQGIQAIRNAMRAAGCPAPIFNATEVFVACILRAHPRAGSWTGVADRGLPYGSLTSLRQSGPGSRRAGKARRRVSADARDAGSPPRRRGRRCAARR